MKTLIPRRGLWIFHIVTVGEQFLFCSPTVNESNGIYLSLAGYLQLPPRIGVRYPPTGRHATSTMFPPFFTCANFNSELWTPTCVLRKLEVPHPTPAFTSEAPKLFQIDLNCVLSSTLTLRRGEPQTPIAQAGFRKSSFTVLRCFLARKITTRLGTAEGPFPDWNLA
jgi:hypothetical protein